MALLGRECPAITALRCVVLKRYYPNDRVMRALGIEPRAPFPGGRVVEQPDWSLLDKVRDRPRMCRDVDRAGTLP